MLRSLLAALVLIAAAIEASDLSARTTNQGEGPHTWAARSSTGRTLNGTWTFVTDAKTGNVTGTWTINDAKGRTIARGGWSAAKAPTGWTGAWRAAVAGGKTEYAGTWNADTDLQPNASLADLFKTAMKNVVSGGWRAGGQSGAWSIRVFE